MKKIVNVRNCPINDIRSKLRFSRLIPIQLMSAKRKNSRPKVQMITPRNLNGFNDVLFSVTTVGIELILRYSNKLHKPMIKRRNPNLN